MSSIVDPMSELRGHLLQVQDIIARTRNFQVDEASDPKEFSKTIVEDVGALAEAVSELIKRSEV
ncbi:hypothetical protein [Arthrobacter sp. ISL-95]|uniref:hypothetical protein n=1 Tax=Arthrobacter sp. ISL-95 TaxID=2819116 RepID=UPI001BE90F85|nr:hypothetical protein [Arthrobacter sp. ISL-95]MBT2585377.1 hypothetical protein [Arthrobacter sp. ISL-95]